jgi:hypothetical protein
MAGVFISYRREDSPGHAGRIFDNLRARLGSDVVFMDVHAIDAGVDFAEALEDAVGSCDALLAIIGPSWISATDVDGRKRLDDPRDFVRIEIGGALKRNVRVVPVLVENADMPTQDDLPDEIKPLTRLNAVAMRDSRWDADIDALVRSVERLITPRAGGDTVARDPTRPGASTGRRKRLWGAAAGTIVLATGAILSPRACAPDPEETLPSATTSSPTTTSPDIRSEPTASPLPSTARRGGLGIGWFGLWLRTITDTPPGVIVGRIASGGPAASAGIQVDDVLIEVAGKPVRSFSDVADAVVDHVGSTPPGTPTSVEVVRNGTHLRLQVVFDREFVLR